MTGNDFEWDDFYTLADSYSTTSNKAKQRTGISRYYYSAFCSSRDYLNKNKIYLNKKSKKIMTTKDSRVHFETGHIFRKHPNFKNNPDGRLISKNLIKLRKMRNEADYDKITSHPLKKMLKNSKILSKEILDLLKKLK